jgi:hypothetical protein
MFSPSGVFFLFGKSPTVEALCFWNEYRVRSGIVATSFVVIKFIATYFGGDFSMPSACEHRLDTTTIYKSWECET